MTPDKLIAVSDGSGDHIMGYYAMFTVPDRFVSASRLQRAWASEALPMNMIPTNRKAVDTFKRACRSVETRRADSSNRVTEIKVDQVDETATECVYQITHMVRDRTQRTIDHPKALKVTFNKTYETIGYDHLSKRYAATLGAIEQAIGDWFDANSAKVPGHKVRNATRALFKSMGAINVRKKAGGIYFVPADERDTLDCLTRALDKTYGDDAEVHLIPCANDDYQKQMVERHYELNVSNEIDELMAFVADKLNSSRAIRSDALGNLLAKRKALGTGRDTYAEIVDTDLATVDEKLRLLDGQVNALIEKVNA